MDSDRQVSEEKSWEQSAKDSKYSSQRYPKPWAMVCSVKWASVWGGSRLEHRGCFPDTRLEITLSPHLSLMGKNSSF